jgi:hypothetical protein
VTFLFQHVDTACKGWYTEDGEVRHAGQCIQDLLELVRLHRVNVDGDVCTVMVTTLVLEVSRNIRCTKSLDA